MHAGLTTTTRFAVPDIRCDRCKTAIEQAVGSLPGVTRVRVSVKGWIVRVDHDPARAATADIAAAISAAGYTIADHQEESQ